MSEESTPKKVPVKKAVAVVKQKVATYVGGMDGIMVHLASGRILSFDRGESHPVMASEATAFAAHPEFTLADEAEKEEEQ